MYRILLNMVLYVQGSTELGFFMYRVLQSKSSLCKGVLLIKVLNVQGLRSMILYVQGSTNYGSLCTVFY